jgi:hypothetical protein
LLISSPACVPAPRKYSRSCQSSGVLQQCRRVSFSINVIKNIFLAGFVVTHEKSRWLRVRNAAKNALFCSNPREINPLTSNFMGNARASRAVVGASPTTTRHKATKGGTSRHPNAPRGFGLRVPVRKDPDAAFPARSITRNHRSSHHATHDAKSPIRISSIVYMILVSFLSGFSGRFDRQAVPLSRTLRPLLIPYAPAFVNK